MNSWENKLVVQNHNDNLYREAEQARLAQTASNKKSMASNPMLANLGRLLVEAGSRLQENYGELHDEFTVERQHA
ncbi:MAG: hypothetical protein U0694_24285 [Anaerolineae bacterium]